MLSVVLAVRNEEANLANCLDSIKSIADEIVIVDEYSNDKTIEIAKKYDARIYKEVHHEIFHITKQKALDYAKYEWILQLDADEIITTSLREEIKQITDASNLDIENITAAKYNDPKNKTKVKLFKRHERIVDQIHGSLGTKHGEIVAFFIPRVNLFLGKPLMHAGAYPDPSIRLVKKGFAKFPAKSVHENMEINGKVSWLFNDMLHNDSPTINKYIMRLNRYTDLHAQELKDKKASKNIIYFYYYSIVKAKLKFFSLYVRHGAYKDGIRGFLWSVFSAWHYPIAYFKYWTGGVK